MSSNPRTLPRIKHAAVDIWQLQAELCEAQKSLSISEEHAQRLESEKLQLHAKMHKLEVTASESQCQADVYHDRCLVLENRCAASTMHEHLIASEMDELRHLEQQSAKGYINQRVCLVQSENHMLHAESEVQTQRWKAYMSQDTAEALESKVSALHAELASERSVSAATSASYSALKYEHENLCHKHRLLQEALCEVGDMSGMLSSRCEGLAGDLDIMRAGNQPQMSDGHIHTFNTNLEKFDSNCSRALVSSSVVVDNEKFAAQALPRTTRSNFRSEAAADSTDARQVCASHRHMYPKSAHASRLRAMVLDRSA